MFHLQCDQVKYYFAWKLALFDEINCEDLVELNFIIHPVGEDTAWIAFLRLKTKSPDDDTAHAEIKGEKEKCGHDRSASVNCVGLLNVENKWEIRT